MLIRPFVQHDLARLTELTIETFRSFYEDSLRPLMGDPFHAPARVLYEKLGCTPLPVTVHYRRL